jgi:AcrR family transcriptional regulator
VLDLLAGGTTVEALSIEAVASRASVGKATIYRRWPNKEALVVDAIAALKGPLPEIVGESVRDDLLTLVGSIGGAFASRAGRIMPCIIPELQRNPELARCYHKLAEPRRQLMTDVLRRGMTTGQLRADLDVDVTIALLVGPMIAQSIMRPHPRLDAEKLPAQIVDAMMPGMLA